MSETVHSTTGKHIVDGSAHAKPQHCHFACLLRRAVSALISWFRHHTQGVIHHFVHAHVLQAVLHLRQQAEHVRLAREDKLGGRSQEDY